jgi:glycine/D-amino acid oxidase-like deaminating enzyme
LLVGDAASLQAQGAGWSVQTDEGPVHAQQAVLAVGVVGFLGTFAWWAKRNAQ